MGFLFWRVWRSIWQIFSMICPGEEEMTKPELDRQDRAILRVLQVEGRISNQELAARTHQAATPCWRRVRQLEQAGVIRGYRAVLDRGRLGYGIMAFIEVSIDSHSEADALRFEREVDRLEEVVACYAVTGRADFMLQVVATDLDAYGQFAMNRIRRLPGIKSMNTMFVLRELKDAPVLPLD
jgi:DNA-binding Lrp family transcriptional regulator